MLVCVGAYIVHRRLLEERFFLVGVTVAIAQGVAQLATSGSICSKVKNRRTRVIHQYVSS
jgi:hypothetical protein